MRTSTFRTMRSIVIAFMVALIGGIGHAATVGEAVQLDVVAAFGLITALALVALPAKRLGVAPITLVLAINQVLIHQICSSRMHAAHLADGQLMHVHAQMEPSLTRMLLVHVVAMLVGVVLLVRAEQAMWRWATRTVTAVVAQARRVLGMVGARRRQTPRTVGCGIQVRAADLVRSRTAQWFSQVTGRRGPPRALAIS